MSLDAMKQALAVLEEIADEVASPYDNKLGDAILALRAAIEQAQQPRKWQGLTDEEINRRKQVDPIRVRIMQEAYDLADRDDSEGYNSVKVMCSEVLGMIDRLLDERQWQGLTDEEIKEIIGPWGDTPIKGYTRKLFDQIEAKLKEKNG